MIFRLLKFYQIPSAYPTSPTRYHIWVLYLNPISHRPVYQMDGKLTSIIGIIAHAMQGSYVSPRSMRIEGLASSL